MRFFTKEWLGGELSDDAFDAAPAAYLRHLAVLRLPPDLAALAAAYLHDARVLDVRHDRPARRLSLRLRCGDLQRGYADVRIVYSGATVDPASLAVLGRATATPRDEVPCDEVDRVGDDGYEHRLLFASGDEARIGFTAVTVSHQAVRDRDSD